jgi:RNA polymerase sigma-70 factor (ECF subfamily)
MQRADARANASDRASAEARADAGRLPADAVWQYREDVWRLASRLCQSREDAEDATQSALLKAAEHLAGFRREASLRTWLHRIATNECRMLRRRKAPVSLDQLPDLGQADIAGQAGSWMVTSDPEQAALAAESRRQVVSALSGLPERYRTAVLLKDGLGMKAGDVATAMGISVPAARSVLHRARLAVRRRLRDPARPS